jgi:hypothetical protein
MSHVMNEVWSAYQAYQMECGQNVFISFLSMHMCRLYIISEKGKGMGYGIGIGNWEESIYIPMYI